MSDTDTTEQVFPLAGIEVDSLLAFLALLGLLRSLEFSRPRWRPRASWTGPPWRARLHVAASTNEREIAEAASAGVEAIASHYDADGRANVAFDIPGFRRYASRAVHGRQDGIGVALASALTAEWPEKRSGGLPAGPLVMLFGQGHQNFLDRLLAVPRGELPRRLLKLKCPPDMRDPGKIAEALFEPWRRTDDADAFRWDPEEDQRYALRFDDPSSAGAAPTVVGANRLAAVGFLSYPCFPATHRATTAGVDREIGQVSFVWPVWTVPLGRQGIERFLSHPALPVGSDDELRPLGVSAVYRARRVSNGKFMNVARASPISSLQTVRAQRRAGRPRRSSR